MGIIWTLGTFVITYTYCVSSLFSSVISLSHPLPPLAQVITSVNTRHTYTHLSMSRAIYPHALHSRPLNSTMFRSRHPSLVSLRGVSLSRSLLSPKPRLSIIAHACKFTSVRHSCILKYLASVLVTFLSLSSSTTLTQDSLGHA